jgi:hypothetical protein
MIGVSLRVFFHPTSAFYNAIKEVTSKATIDNCIKIKTLVLKPECSEVRIRSKVENPKPGEEDLIKIDISNTIGNIRLLNQQVKSDIIEDSYYESCPYCTLVIFPDKCYYSPNLLSPSVPVKLPMIIFKKNSHGYDILNEYFEYMWVNKNIIN